MIHTAKVVAVYPDGTCDIILDKGTRFARVPIGSASMSTDGGFWGTASVERPESEQVAAQPSTTGRNVIAVVAVAGAAAVILCFIHPSGTVMSFTEDDRMVLRHPKSGGYLTWAPDGSYEVWTAGGAYFRMGTGPHEDLASKTSGAKWDVPAGPAPTMTWGHPHFSAVVDPEGNATYTSPLHTFVGPIKGTATISAAGNITAGAGTGDSADLLGHTHGYLPGGGMETQTTAPTPGS